MYIFLTKGLCLYLQAADLFRTLSLKKMNLLSTRESTEKGRAQSLQSGRQPAATGRWLEVCQRTLCPNFFITGLFFSCKSLSDVGWLTRSTKLLRYLSLYPGFRYAVILPGKCLFRVVFVVVHSLDVSSANTLTYTSGSI